LAQCECHGSCADSLLWMPMPDDIHSFLED
jgi:hypothetical protein